MRTDGSSGIIFCIMLGIGGCSTADNMVRKTTANTPPNGTTYSWTFDESTTGDLPAAWIKAETHGRGKPASWAVQTDDDAASKPGVLTLNTSNTSGTFNLCVADQPQAADVELSVRVRAETGEEDQGGGLVWRYRDADNYYVARWNPLEANYSLYKVVESKRTLITEVDASDQTMVWMPLRVVHVGQQIDCYIDDQRVITVKDDSLSKPGQVGLWSKADASSSFDDFQVTIAE